jgi:predicted homoserine dehydrogenase-like protein
MRGELPELLMAKDPDEYWTGFIRGAGRGLDGEGGYTVWGKLVPAERSRAEGALPIGLAHHVRLMRDIATGGIVRWADVAISDSEAVGARQDMERRFAARTFALAA